MKKITFAAIAAVAAVMISSCGNTTPRASLKNEVDTMSYAIGMAQTQGLKEYLVGSLDMDTAYMADFIKGLNEGAKYRFFIPYRLGYGAGGAGASIPPYAALIFDVELIQVV